MGGDSTFSKGDHVDRFEIRELIAEGGMGAIYRAVDTRLRKTVALKVVRGDRLAASTGEQARQRFLREALAMSKVDHRNVVRVLDFGFSKDDTPYLAMEYPAGPRPRQAGQGDRGPPAGRRGRRRDARRVRGASAPVTTPASSTAI